MVEELLKKIVGGIPVRIQLGFVGREKQQIYYKYNQINETIDPNGNLYNDIENPYNETFDGKAIKNSDTIIPVMDETHPAAIVGISKTHFLLAAITHTKRRNWFIGLDSKGVGSYMGLQYYYYIPIKFIALYVNIMDLYKVTYEQAGAVIDKSVKDLESDKQIPIREVFKPESIKDYSVGPEDLKMKVIGDDVRVENIGETLDKLNVLKNFPLVDANEYSNENFKNDINIECLKSFQYKPGDE